MKKTLLTTALLAATTLAQAHELWVTSPATAGANSQISGEIGYGHNFPAGEPIATERLAIFKPLEIIGMDGKRYEMSQKGENYQYLSKDKIPAGAYWLNAVYQPTFWSKNKAGWKKVNMTEMPDAEYCEQTRMYGKNIVNVGHDSADTAVITRPVDHLLEIVPLDNPANVRVGELFKVKVLYKGEPLATVPVTATFEGFDLTDRKKSHKVEAQAFYDVTAADGTVDIIPLRQGFWKASVEYKADYADQKVCQKQASYSTLTFEIGHTHH